MALRSRFSPALTFIFILAVLDIMAMGIIFPVMPMIVEEMAGSEADGGFYNGMLVAVWAAMQFIFSPIIGSLSDRYGRRPVILISSAGLAVDFILMALAPSLWWLAFARILGGITSSNFVTVFAYMADITPPEKRAKAYGLIGAAFSGGFVFGPFLGGILGEWGPRLPFWVGAGITGVAVLYGAFVLPESLPPEKRMAFSWKRANPFGALQLLRSHPELSSLSVVNFLLYFSHHVFSAVFVLYAAHRYGWGPMEVGLLLGLVGLLDMMVQGVLVGPAVKRFGDRRVMVFGLIFGGIGMTCMGLAPTTYLFIAAMLPNALWGLAMPTIQSLMTARVSESEQGQLQGANNSVGSIAGVFSPLFFGTVYGMSVGPNPVIPHIGAAFFIGALTLIAAGAIGYFAGRRADEAALQNPALPIE